MPINCLINFEQFVNNSCSKNKNFSPLMLINCLINSEQIVNNSWTILVQSLFKQSIRAPKNESRFDETIHEHTWRGKRKKRAEKNNNFERFFGDSTLTFLTFGNTYRLQILPTRRLVLLRGRERKIWGRQIFPGCAPKIAVFKGNVTKKGRSRGSSHISIQI